MDDTKPVLTEFGNVITASEDANGAGNSDLKRVRLPENEKTNREDLLILWEEQNRYIDQLEAKLKVRVFLRKNAGPLRKFFLFYHSLNTV